MRINYPITGTFILLVFFLLSSVKSFGLYDCVMSYNDDVTTSYKVVRPVSEKCYDKCKKACSRAFEEVDVDPESIGDSILPQCITRCQNGHTTFSISHLKKFLGGIKEDPGQPIGSLTLSTSCTSGLAQEDSVSYPTDSEVTVIQNDKIYISIVPSAEVGNIIYTKGVVNKEIIPHHDSMDPANWGTSINNNTTHWHARNSRLYDTSLDVQDGDFLSITFGGLYSSRIGSTLQSNEVTTCPQNDADITAGLECTFHEPIYLIAANRTGTFTTSAMSTNNTLDGFTDPYVAPYGLQFLNRWDAPYMDDITSTNKDSPFASFAGVVSGFSATTTKPLTLAHYNGDRNDNLGGMRVFITQKKSPIAHRGEGLQYAIVRETEKPDASTVWYNVPHADFATPAPMGADPITNRAHEAVMDATKFPTDQARGTMAEIYFRIDPSRFTSLGDGIGGYNVKVSKNVKSYGKIKDFIHRIRLYLFGDGNTGGALKYIFNELIAHSFFVSWIKITIALAIAWTALKFMIGASSATQEELLFTIGRLAAVSLMLSDKSWEICRIFVFDAFIHGFTGLVTLFTVFPAMQTPVTNSDPLTIFDVVEQNVIILMSASLWSRIMGLSFSSIMGAAFAMLAAMAIINYLFAIFKVLFSYLVSLFFIGILIMMSPFFIPMYLLPYTRPMFNSWLSALMTYVLQPVIGIVCLVFFHYVFMLALKAGLGFATCKTCLINAFGICVQPYPASIYALYSGDSGGSMSPFTMTQLTAVLFLALLSYSITLCFQIADIVTAAIGQAPLNPLQFVGAGIGKGIAGLQVGSILGAAAKAKSTGASLGRAATNPRAALVFKVGGGKVTALKKGDVADIKTQRKDLLRKSAGEKLDKKLEAGKEQLRKDLGIAGGVTTTTQKSIFGHKTRLAAKIGGTHLINKVPGGILRGKLRKMAGKEHESLFVGTAMDAKSAAESAWKKAKKAKQAFSMENIRKMQRDVTQKIWEMKHERELKKEVKKEGKEIKQEIKELEKKLKEDAKKDQKEEKIARQLITQNVRLAPIQDQKIRKLEKQLKDAENKDKDTTKLEEKLERAKDTKAKMITDMSAAAELSAEKRKDFKITREQLKNAYLSQSAFQIRSIYLPVEQDPERINMAEKAIALKRDGKDLTQEEKLHLKEGKEIQKEMEEAEQRRDNVEVNLKLRENEVNGSVLSETALEEDRQAALRTNDTAAVARIEQQIEQVKQEREAAEKQVESLSEELELAQEKYDAVKERDEEHKSYGESLKTFRDDLGKQEQELEDRRLQWKENRRKIARDVTSQEENRYKPDPPKKKK